MPVAPAGRKSRDCPTVTPRERARDSAGVGFWERHVNPTTHLPRARPAAPSMLRQEAIRPAPSTAIWNGTSLTASNAAFTTRRLHRSRPIPPTQCSYPRQCSPAAIRRIAHMIDSRTHVRRTGLPVRVGFSLTYGSAHLPRWNRRVRTQSVMRKGLGHAWDVNLRYRSPHGLPLFGTTAPRTRTESVMPCSLAIPALHDGRIGAPQGNGDSHVAQERSSRGRAPPAGTCASTLEQLRAAS